MVVLIDAKHVGVKICHGRRAARIKREDAAKLLKISYADLRRIEGGAMCPPESVLHRLCMYGFVLMNARQMENYNNRCKK